MSVETVAERPLRRTGTWTAKAFFALDETTSGSSSPMGHWS